MLTEEQLKAKKAYQQKARVRKWHKKARCRILKNFLIWLSGFLSFFIIIGLVLVIAVGIIPVKTYVGEDQEYVSEEIANNSVFKNIKNIGQYTVGDIPVLSNALVGLTESIGIDGIVTIDTDKVNAIAFSSITGGNFTTEIKDALSINATLKNVSEKLGFSMGELGELSIFSQYELVPETDRPSAQNIADKTVDTKSFYYIKELGAVPEENVYSKAFDENGYVDGVDETTELYYPALNEVPIMDCFSLLGSSFKRIKISDVINKLGGGSESSSINDIIGDKTIGELGEFDIKTMELEKVLKKDTENPNNVKLWNILEQAIVGTGEEGKILLGDLTDNFNTNEILLETVLEKDTTNVNNVKLWNILEQAVTGSGTNGEIKVGDLGANFDIDNVKINVILDKNSTDVQNNKILKTLLKDDDATLGDIATKINELDVAEVFEIECFTNKTVYGLEYYKKDIDGVITYKPAGEVGDPTGWETGYYIDKANSNVWLFLLFDYNCFSGENTPNTKEVVFDANGNAKIYSARHLTVNDLSSQIGELSKFIMNASVRQFIDAGMLDEQTSGQYSTIYTFTVQEVFNTLAAHSVG